MEYTFPKQLGPRKAVDPRYGTVGLQPAARPVDQFYRPEARMPAQTNQLMQLAQALSGAHPELLDIAQRRFAAHVEGSQIQAAATRERLKLSNQASLKDAVEKGLIQDTDNPWFMVALRKGVAEHEARTAAETLRQTYHNSPEKDADDVVPVGRLADGHFHPLLKDRDAYEVAAMQPIFEQAKAAILREHVEKRRIDRTHEMDHAIGGKVGDAMRGANALDYLDPASQSVAAVAANVQATFNDAAKVMRSDNAVRAVVQATLAAGEAAKNGDMAAAVLARVVGPDGRPLSDDPRVMAAIEESRDRIADRELKTLRTDRELDEDRRQRAYRAAWDAHVDRTGGDMRVPLAMTVDDLKRLGPDYATRIWNIAGSQRKDAEAEAGRTLLGGLQATALRGGLRGDALLTLPQTLAAAGLVNELGPLLSLQDRYDRERWGKTDPEVFKQLLFKGKDLTVAEVVSFQDHLGKDDLEALTMRAVALRAGKDDQFTTHALRTVSPIMLEAWVRAGGLTDPNQDSPGRAGLQPYIDRAEAIVAKELLGVDWNAIEPEKREDTAARIVDEAVRKTLVEFDANLKPLSYRQWYSPDRPQTVFPPPPKPVRPADPKEVKKIGPGVRDPFLDLPEDHLRLGDYALHPDVPIVDSPGVSRGKTWEANFPNMRPQSIVGSGGGRMVSAHVNPPPTGGDPLGRLMVFRKEWDKRLNAADKPGWVVDVSRSDKTAFVKPGRPTFVPSLRRHFQKQEAEMWQEAVSRAQDLEQGPLSPAGQASYRQALDAIQARQDAGMHGVLKSEVDIVRDFRNALKEYNYLRAYAGYTPEEAKARLGDDAWKHVKVVANEAMLTDLAIMVPIFKTFGMDGPGDEARRKALFIRQAMLLETFRY